MLQHRPNRVRTRLWLTFLGAIAACSFGAVGAAARPATPDFPIHHKTAAQHAHHHHVPR
jgi:hypothetical protein